MTADQHRTHSKYEKKPKTTQNKSLTQFSADAFLALIVLLLGVAYVSINWQYWFQNVEEIKVLCSLPKDENHHGQTVSDFRACLSAHHITPTDSDIRKQCSYIAHDKYLVSGTNDTENSYYLNCIHAEGLSQ
jgi:hypothetical protein